MFTWAIIAAQLLLGLSMLMPSSKSWLFVPRNLVAIALISSAASELQKLKKNYEDIERTEDIMRALKDTQAEEQLLSLESIAKIKTDNEQADKNLERQMRTLEQTAPIFSEMLAVTGRNGAIERMALGMIQSGESIGNVLMATSEAEIKLEQARYAAQAQLQLQKEKQPVQDTCTSTQSTQSQLLQLPQVDEEETAIKKASSVVDIATECIKVDKAPSYKRLIFKLKTDDFASLGKWKSAMKLALGVSYELPVYIYGPEQVAIEIALRANERTYYDFPKRTWEQGGRKIILGQSLEGEITIDLASEDTPQILIVGTTGSGKSNCLRAIAYALLMQGNRVDICGGKVSDYEDFSGHFPSISINDMGKAFELVGEYYAECDRRNRMSKQELDQQPAWILLIDEYKGTVPIDEKICKIYDGQSCEVARRGRGLKIHIAIGLQHGSLRSKNDPQGLPPDLRANLPARIAFRCTNALAGRMVLHHRGEIVTSLQGRGDGIIQSGLLDQRFQAYRFDRIPV